MYHTNVVMAIGSGFAVVCGEAIAHAQHREAVFNKLRASGHDIVDVSLGQMQRVRRQRAGAGSRRRPGDCAVDDGLAQSWRRRKGASWSRTPSLIPVAIPTIERIGGGGVRCMLAELHLPKAAGALDRI